MSLCLLGADSCHSCQGVEGINYCCKFVFLQRIKLFYEVRLKLLNYVIVMKRLRKILLICSFLS